jgi:4-amino-4-deoxy-L-arabinose transferase-like glycosyltransferase
MNNLRKYKLELIVTVIWLIVIFLVNPIGDFPLNDDWCYGKSVKTLLEENYLKLYNWGEMTLVGQIYWGYLFVKIFGFSFTVLRCSTLILALISFFGLIRLFRLIEMSETLILISVAFIMFNPIFLELSFTYMTDIPFYTISIFVFYYFLKAIKTENVTYVYCALLCCALAYSIRQLALIYPISWFVFSILSNRNSVKSHLKSFLLLLLFVGFALTFEFVLKQTGVMQERYNSKLHLLFEKIINIDKAQVIYSINLLFTTFTYIGLFLSPLLVLRLNVVSLKFKQFFIPIYSLIVFIILYRYDYILPSLDNIWIDFGVGPFTIYNETAHFNTTPAPNLKKGFYYSITLIGIISGSLLFYRFFNGLKSKRLRIKSVSRVRLFIVIVTALYLAPFLIVGLYDRYLLPLFPLALIFVFYKYKPKFNTFYRLYLGGFLTCLIWFSVCATHDYLSWNRKRWEIISYLTTKQNVPVNKINGGAEFITWYHFSETEDKWWENVTPVFVITTDVSKNDNIINTLTYKRWLPGEAVLYLVYNKHLDH